MSNIVTPIRSATLEKMDPPLKSDISISAQKFAPEAIPELTLKANEEIAKTLASIPKWWDVGAAKVREMTENGETPLPVTVFLSSGHSVTIPSRDPSRTIPCRLFYPNDVTIKAACKGIILHIHGGGWVIGSEREQDGFLKTHADNTGCVVISSGYRLAPEHPFPAGPEDCNDVAEFLVDRGEEEYGAPLKFIGGESAGGHLSLLVTYHLLRTRPKFSFHGLFFHFGCFNVAAPRNVSGPVPVLSPDAYIKFVQAFLPTQTLEEKQHPSISPYYEDLSQFRGRLPSAIFTCGTADILLDDTVTMATKWLMFGGEAVVKIYPGAAHGFIFTPSGLLPQAKEAVDDTLTFIRERL